MADKQVEREIRALGYIEVQTNDMERWRKLAFGVLGFAEGSGPDENALYLRMDERAARIIVTPGESDGVTVVGWEVRDQEALDRLRETVTAAGVEVRDLTQAEADARRVEAAIAFTDPAGTKLEVFHGALLDHSPVVTPFGAKFVTGAQGLGHVVIPVPDQGAAYDFYVKTLGFLSRGAFRMPAPPEYGPLRIRFFGVNQRHHSLAMMPSPKQGPGLIHVMVEVDTLDAVGEAQDRVVKEGISLSSTIGRHTNDKMVSFYVRAPGGWDIEFGCQGMLVDEEHYTAEEITADSYWGHDWSGSEPLAVMQ
ncbi:biphenyl-2,3-diol 1,2-dioxygenase [Tomitella fengzijianii]|uniref:Biphenyl-2,3-diol 1,2-dioxygenase n=1 Tax=Tomitella fengzijianii TaxID=2597660 RepID=A0A516X0U7_9ACTN|nr:biphenyl-2,3-diol 1,2-dioxygenase [Tomitella fengzijianii]QDQ96231.1 biphenyl-2,3-diol 1,2-dioxygenase [Tomitella fengzijianii]